MVIVCQPSPMPGSHIQHANSEEQHGDAIGWPRILLALTERNPSWAGEDMDYPSRADSKNARVALCQNLPMADFFQRFFQWLSKRLAAAKAWLSVQLIQASVPATAAFSLMCLTAMAAYQFWGNPLLVVLCIVLGNTLIQMCIDYFPSNIKPRFSAISRIIPAVAAVIAYLLSRTA